jgi:hypothetical protein
LIDEGWLSGDEPSVDDRGPLDHDVVRLAAASDR